MRRAALTRLVAVAVALSAVVAVAPSARADQRDRAVTSAYLHAVYRFDHAAYADRSAWRREVHALVRSVAAVCRGALANAPLDEDFSRLETETRLTPFLVAFRMDRRAERAFLHVIGGLRWSDPKVNRVVRRELAVTKWLYGVRMPDLCGDARGWAASGYRRLSSGTTSFVNELRHPPIVEPGSEAEPDQLVSRYEGPGDRRLARRLHRLQARLDGANLHILEHAGNTMLRDLGVKKAPLPPRELPSAVET